MDLLVARAKLGECPVWSVPEQCLYWVDIDGKAVHRYDPATGRDESRPTAGRPGSLALTAAAGRLLVAMEHQVGWFAWQEGDFRPWIDLEPPGTGNRLNDGRCDPAGRFWVGSMYEDTSAGKFTGMLHVVEPSGEARTVRREVGVSNGLAFSADGDVMYHADTPHRTVWAYDFDPATGERTDERVFLDFAGLAGKPDGACVDAEGAYWVACVRGGGLARARPDGTVERVIDLPFENPTMPAFGGPDLTTLFVTSIGGGLWALDPGVPGVVEPLFGG